MYHYFYKHSITSQDELTFSPDRYSRFKFGDAAIAKDFGYELADAFIHEYKEILLAQKGIVVLPSPYYSIPTASGNMTTHFIDRINFFLYTNNIQPVYESKIHRYKTYSIDYGNLSYEERMQLISTDTYYLDKHFLQNRLCIFIDDIKITGSHEQVVKNIIEQNELSGVFFFLYYAAVKNNAVIPQFENYLNYYSVKGIDELILLINGEDFKFNTRVIKYLLKLPEQDLEKVKTTIKKDKLSLLVKYAIGNSYYTIKEYKNNLNNLINFLNYGN